MKCPLLAGTCPRNVLVSWIRFIGKMLHKLHVSLIDVVGGTDKIARCSFLVERPRVTVGEDSAGCLAERWCGRRHRATDVQIVVCVWVCV